MLRKFAYNKIFRTTGMFLLLLLLVLFPTSKEYTLQDTKTKKTAAINTQKREVFLLDKEEYVARCMVDISFANKEEYAKELVELMIIDGKYEDDIPNGFKAILPSDIRLNSLSIDNDSIIIDLSKEFYNIKKEYETKALEMLTYNLTTIDGINKLYINIDGKKLETLVNSNKNVSQPFTRNDGINKKTLDLINYKNTNKTTIYFVSKNSGNYYYVPVTKISNNQDEKIKIIINELTSSHIYETNLMSFLNYNAKLIDYNIKDNVLTLNFNKYLFDDVNTSSILEEVIYSISLSVRDNYNVEEVIFNVDGKEITKSVIKNIE